MKRINVNLNDNLLKQVDEYAEECGITRSAAICVLLNTALKLPTKTIKS